MAAIQVDETSIDSFSASISSNLSQDGNHSAPYHLQCTSQKTKQFSELESLKQTSSEHYSFVELQNKIGALSEDSSHQLHAINHYAFIREASFSEPEFWLIKEFNPPDPTLKSINDARYPENQLPWFVAPSQQYKLKIAGWRDSNSLYRGNLRFYS